MKKVMIILFLSALLLAAGTVVVYYNTASFGYDNANIIVINNNSISIMDIVIDYENVKDKIRNAVDYSADSVMPI